MTQLQTFNTLHTILKRYANVPMILRCCPMNSKWICTNNWYRLWKCSFILSFYV